MHKTKRTSFVSLALFFSIGTALVACGGEQEATAEYDHRPGAEGHGYVMATACPEGQDCQPEEQVDPPALRDVSLILVNRTTLTATSTYAVVVKAPSGSTRSAMSRWGNMVLDANGAATIPTPAKAYDGDRVEVTVNTVSGSSTMGLKVMGPLSCTGYLDPIFGESVSPSVTCS